MNTLWQTDQELLEIFLAERSETAFRQLVERYMPLALSASTRILVDHMLAEESAQNVFLILAKKATECRNRPSLASWIYQTAVFSSKNIKRQTMREEQKRQSYQIDQNKHHNQEAQMAWTEIQGDLEDALAILKKEDRDAVLLRYFGGYITKEVAQILGISAEAAQKRIVRAIEKLRQYIGQQGVEVKPSVFVLAIGEYGYVPTSPHLITRTVENALSASAVASATSATLSVPTLLAMTSKTKIIIGLTVITAGLVTKGIYTKIASRSELGKVETTEQLSPKKQDLGPRSASRTNNPQKSSARLNTPTKETSYRIQEDDADYAAEQKEMHTKINANRAYKLGQKLVLTDEQKAKLKAFFEKKTEAQVLQSVWTRSPDPADFTPKKMTELEKLSELANSDGFDGELASILTDEQKKAYDELRLTEKKLALETSAMASFSSLQQVLGITEEQRDQVYQIITNQTKVAAEGGSKEDKAADAIAKNLFHQGKYQQLLKHQEETNKRKIEHQIKSFESIFTDEQLKRYREYLEENNKSVGEEPQK